MRNILFVFVAALVFVAPAMGQHLGVHGSLWEIQEEDAADYVKRRVAEKVADGTVAKMQKESTEQIVNSILNPHPVDGIKPVTKSSVHFFDPTVALDRDIRDVNGRLLFPAGTKVNPLAYGGLSKRLIFIDARHPDQVDFALSEAKKFPRDAIILVGGSWLDVSRKLGAQAYFDQGGAMSRRFELSNVPAIVSQNGLMLKIEEVLTKKSTGE
jgi:conjugal transfer pilus assembly protein TraW